MFNRHFMIIPLLMLNTINYAADHTSKEPLRDQPMYQLPPLETLLRQDPYPMLTDRSLLINRHQKLACIQNNISQVRAQNTLNSERLKWCMEHIKELEEDQSILAHMLDEQNEIIDVADQDRNDGQLAILRELQNMQPERKRKRDQNEPETLAHMQPPTKRRRTDKQALFQEITQATYDHLHNLEEIFFDSRQADLTPELLADFHEAIDNHACYSHAFLDLSLLGQELQRTELESPTGFSIEKANSLFSLASYNKEGSESENELFDKLFIKVESELEEAQEAITSKGFSE